MGGFSKVKADLEKNNITLVAASSDPQDKAAETAAEIGFPVGYGVDQATAESLGAYWEANRQFIQPTEIVLTPENQIVQVSYSDGPLARTEAEDVVNMVGFLMKRRQGG